MTNEISYLSQSVVDMITPFLPYLTNAVKLVGEGAAKKLGELGAEETYDKAKVLWKTIKSRKNKELANATELLVARPKDNKRKDILASILAEMLTTDKELFIQLTSIIGENSASQEITATESKLRSIRQENDGAGKQKITAQNSVIEGVIQKQIKKN